MKPSPVIVMCIVQEEKEMGNSLKVIHVNIAFLNMEPTDSLKQYATEKLTNCIQKFSHQDTEAHLVLKVEKTRHIAELSMHLSGADFNVTEESENLYASIDKMSDALSQQLRKHKERVTAHH